MQYQEPITAEEQREEELAQQNEAERIERQIEEAKERAEEGEKQSDYDYLLSCLHLPFNTD